MFEKTAQNTFCKMFEKTAQNTFCKFFEKTAQNTFYKLFENTAQNTHFQKKTAENTKRLPKYFCPLFNYLKITKWG